jgi:biotin carboxyl carrier protein
MIYVAYKQNLSKERSCLDSIDKGHSSVLKQHNSLSDGMVLYRNTKYEFRYLFKLSDSSNKQMILHYQNQFYAIEFESTDGYVFVKLSNDKTESVYKLEHGYWDDYNFELIINQHKYIIGHHQKDSSVRSPVGGKIIELMYKDGDMVTKGDVYIKIECMKMIMGFPTERSGSIVYHKSVGDIVVSNEKVATIESVDPTEDETEVFGEDTENIMLTHFSDYTTTEDLYKEYRLYNFGLLKNSEIINQKSKNERIDIHTYPKYFSDHYTHLNVSESDSEGTTDYTDNTNSVICSNYPIHLINK